MAFVGRCTADDRISFSNWMEALAAAGLPPAQVADFKREIILFLAHCRRAHAPASINLVRAYLQHHAQRPEPARAALRWWFRAARLSPQHSRVSPAERPCPRPADATTTSVAGLTPVAPESISSRRLEPPAAATDRGGADWERDLITAMRRVGFLWRTEKAYRMWAVRFATFVRPHSPYRATAQEVGDFLSELAVAQRASPSTQKQALNALVFFLQEGLKRTLDPIDFQRARPRRRMPVVLSRDEARRLFEQLDGTSRLMAELAYGAGLRLLELLRLRVQDLDLPRGSLIVRGGKGTA
jgi:hypothetical protein